MNQHRRSALVGAALLCVLNAAPVHAESCAPSVADAGKSAKPKKKGFGLGGILKAARNAGVGDLLSTGNLLGDSKTAQVAGAAAGTAAAASGGSAVNVAGTLVGLTAQGRTAQVAGAVTGTAVEFARAGSPAAAMSRNPAEHCTAAPAAETAPPAMSWN